LKHFEKHSYNTPKHFLVSSVTTTKPCPPAREATSLKRFKDDVKQVESGYECGMGFEGFNDIQEGDRVIAYERIEKRPSLYDND
jgi:translation initiation factor IF-2